MAGENRPKLVQEEVEKLTKNVRAIRSVVEYGAVPGLLKRLNDVSPEIEELKSGESREGCFANKIKDLDKTIEDIASWRDWYCRAVQGSEVVGRDRERDSLMLRLLGHGGSTGPVDIIAVIGVGGIGKTTLARLVYDNEAVKSHFHPRIWVTVSQTFDEVGMANAISQSLGGDFGGSLWQRVSASIKDKRFFLVLDDVWPGEERRWEGLKKALECGCPGSKILVTARDSVAAEMMGVKTDDVIWLQGLPEQDCGSVFSRQAFSDENDPRALELENIGRRIVRKCNGSPLIAKSVGRLLRFKSSAEWREVLRTVFGKSGAVDGTFFPFFLSYYDLSVEEKNCLLYCSVFPKHYEIDVDNLIDMWMSQGYLNGDGVEFERQGRSCFNRLMAQSFFQDFEEDCDGNIIRCKMTGVAHDFVQSLAKDEFSMKSFKEGGGGQANIWQRACHVMFSTDELISHGELCSENGLHTLLFSNHSGHRLDDSLRQVDDIVENQTLLKTLDLSSCAVVELPVKIGELKHLRYLNLSNNRVIEMLPETICKLSHLQTLRMSNCVKLRQLPEGIGELVNLRHLYLDWCPSLQGLPKGIQKLTCLRTLSTYVVPEKNFRKDEDTLKLEDLGSLKLAQLSLCMSGCHNIESYGEAESAGLKDNQYLESLWLQFGATRIGSDNDKKQGEEERGILEALQPHPKLLSLCIGSYGGNKLPNWIMSLHNLKRLDLFHIPNCNTLPPLGQLPNLESLELFGMEELKKLGIWFLVDEGDSTSRLARRTNVSSSFVSFPKLKELCFDSMEWWEEWEWSVDSKKKYVGSIIMPCLDSLEFSNCPRLKELPGFLRSTSLKTLSISYSDILERRCDVEVGEDWLKICHIPEIKIISQEDEE